MFENSGRNRLGTRSKPTNYDPADSEWGILSPRPTTRWPKRRPSKRVIAVLVLLFVAAIYSLRSWNERRFVERQREMQRQAKLRQEEAARVKAQSLPQEPVKPPLFERYHLAELDLPQHHVEDPFAGGKKYLWVENHVHSLGWGNHFQDLLFNALLAHNAGRAFVFDNYTWNRDGSLYTDYNGKGKLIPSQIPLSALISGPINGGPFFENDAQLRAIHLKHWKKICPNPVTVWTQDVNKIINQENPSALTILNAWTEHLKKIDEPCLQVDGGSDRIFDMYIYGMKERLLDIWPVLKESPLMKLFGYSPLIHAAFEKNRELFSTIPVREPYYPCHSIPAIGNVTGVNPPTRCNDPYTPLPGLLALHLRRGDFEGHCQHLANWTAAWMGFNSFPEFPDQWVRPEGGGWGETTKENMELYMRKCYPEISQIVSVVDEVRRSPAGQGLKDIYIMTNGKREWVADLKASLRAMGGWDKIASSRDLVISAEQKEVAQAVDMMIGEKAQALIGNGWSSMTANIVMVRMARGMRPDSNRFW